MNQVYSVLTVHLDRSYCTVRVRVMDGLFELQYSVQYKALTDVLQSRRHRQKF